jgi:hypothetical protein
MRTRVMLICTQLAFLMVSCALIVVGPGTHIVFKIGQTCCAVELASVTLG